jgi:hypothetical protein
MSQLIARETMHHPRYCSTSGGSASVHLPPQASTGAKPRSTQKPSIQIPISKAKKGGLGPHCTPCLTCRATTGVFPPRDPSPLVSIGAASTGTSNPCTRGKIGSGRGREGGKKGVKQPALLHSQDKNRSSMNNRFDRIPYHIRFVSCDDMFLTLCMSRADTAWEEGKRGGRGLACYVQYKHCM